MFPPSVLLWNLIVIECPVVDSYKVIHFSSCFVFVWFLVIMFPPESRSHVIHSFNVRLIMTMKYSVDNWYLTRRFYCLRLVSDGIYLQLICILYLDSNLWTEMIITFISICHTTRSGIPMNDAYRYILNIVLLQTWSKSDETTWERGAKNRDGNWRRFRNTVTSLTLRKAPESIFEYPTSFSLQFSTSSRSV